MIGEAILQAALHGATALLTLGLICAFVRLVLGPSPADRVVALDMVSLLLVGFAALAAIIFDEAAFLDVAITLALVGFLGSVALARYIERLAAREATAATDPKLDGGP